MKKLIVALSCIFVVLLGGAICVSAGTYGDLTYKISNGEVTITDCKESATTVTIPETIEGYPVTGIGYEAFEYCNSLKSVTIPDSVTSIGYSAFEDCTSLESITIGDGVTSIGDAAFAGCRSLASITIPDSVTSIGDAAFGSCSSLESVTIPDNVYSIGGGAFEGCTGLEEVYWNAVDVGGNKIFNFPFQYSGSPAGLKVIFGNKVKTIPYYAFFYCENLKSIKIPNSITEIGIGAFGGCNSLEQVDISDVVAWCNIEFGDTSANPLCYAKKLYLNGNLITDLVIPEGVTSIKDNAFYGCSSLISITLPDSITSIGKDAFNKTGYYTNSTNWENDILYINNYLINAKDTVSSVNIKHDTKTIVDSAFYNCSSLTNITIPDSVTSIGTDAFYGCSNLATVTIGEGVANIGDSAFSGCSAIEKIYWNAANINDFNSDNYIFKNVGTTLGVEVIFGDNVKRVPDYAFDGCKNLKSVTISNSVTSIGTDAFYGCSNLATITIGEGVTNIGNSAFSGCSAMEKIYWNALEVEDFSYENNIFKGTGTNSGFEVIFGDSAEKIPINAFRDCINLKRVTIGNGITSIGAEAFFGCQSLVNIIIPDNVKNIGEKAFYDCSGLKSATISKGITSLSKGVFEGCNSLEEITLPFVGLTRGETETETSVFGAIFGNSGTATVSQKYTDTDNVEYSIPSSLKKVTITDETAIPCGAFSNCNRLTEIIIIGSPKIINKDAFYGCTGLLDVTVESKEVKYPTSNIFYNAELVTLHGYRGSTTETYATKFKNEIYFKEIVENEPDFDETTSTARRVNNKIVIKAICEETVSEQSLHIALYSSSNAMVDYIIVPDDEPFDTMNVVFKDNPSASYAKIFLWNSIESLEPVSNAVTLEIK